MFCAQLGQKKAKMRYVTYCNITYVGVQERRCFLEGQGLLGDSGSCLLAQVLASPKRLHRTDPDFQLTDQDRPGVEPFKLDTVQLLFSSYSLTVKDQGTVGDLSPSVISDLAFCTTSLLIEYGLDSITALGSRICRLLCSRISGRSKSLCNFETRGSRFHILEERLQAIQLHSIDNIPIAQTEEWGCG